MSTKTLEKLGTQDNPYTHAPEDWNPNGVPYGAFCKCVRCGYVGTSTFTFDYYAKGAGDALTCERCRGYTPDYSIEKVQRKAAVEAFEEDSDAISNR